VERITVVTGAGRGIGAATARAAARAGHTVCINYLADEHAALGVVAEIVDDGGQAIAVQGDVAVEADVVALFDTVDRELGPLTALVNNAGIVQPATTIDGIDAARLSRVLAVNVTGSFLCAREAVRRMSVANRGGGSIVNVSSAAARLGSPGEYLDYAATKGAIDTFTIGLAKEVARYGIRVNAVRPGIIDTDIHAPGRVVRLQSAIPLQRPGDPDEVARSIVWLLSDEASYVTGAILDVSGGR
jgi:NAD(P)-dependent dehydrogenase (short-subunit alcohol dehydrogenase family)